MAYVAVKGGTLAIEESIKRLKYERLKNGKIVDSSDIEGAMRGLIDQVMSESSIYSRELAAIAIKQAEGSPEEAVFLLRAYRSTLPRKHYSRIVETKDMHVERRISAAFKDIPGGQILGASYDYTHRLIDFSLVEEDENSGRAWLKDFLEDNDMIINQQELSSLPKVSDYLRKERLLPEVAINNKEPKDITKEHITFPTGRSERLQTLTRGMTQAVISLGYASLRGFGSVHPTVGELRIGNIEINVDNPLNNGDDFDDSYYVGEVKITECENIIPVTVEKANGRKEIAFDIGYGIAYGQNETKAIAMGILDKCLETKNLEFPTHNEEFVLLHIDSVEATGFISHLKLPHYVTFQAKLNSMRSNKKGEK